MNKSNSAPPPGFRFIYVMLVLNNRT